MTEITTDLVRAAWQVQTRRSGAGRAAKIAEADAVFDAWLAEHDRQVAEKAWSGSGNALVTWLANDLRSERPTNPYRDVAPSAPTLATEGA